MPRHINTEYDIVRALEAIEEELIASMINNLDRHRAEETKEGIEWSQWQVEQLAALEKYKRHNNKKYKTTFKNINSMIDSLISEQRAAGNASQEIAILNAIKKGLDTHRVSANILGEFFKVNDRKMDALIKATKNDLKKAEHAMLRMANDKYRKVIFNAQAYAASGTTYKKAVDMATRDFLSAGINCVEYKNGARHTVQDYADMCIRTANKRAYLTGEGEMRMSWGITTVIMNKRTSPCPKCLPFVGKVLIDDVWSGGTPRDGPYQLMSRAIAAGLYH
ncbi:MAG: phage minor capsid protein [Lachnospiraceae bacterium]|nr:phage minor capsid protein [Lachnospiraceae bacterium]